jgi:hypothetical protein
MISVMPSDQTDTTTRREIVRCMSCHGTMQQGLFRCPHCGQITTGNEKKVSELFLSMQMKARVAERKATRTQCRNCGNPVEANGLCSECEAKHRRNVLIFVLVGVVVVTFLLLRWVG